MKTTIKKVSKKDLHIAAISAKNTLELHKGTKLAFWCNKFISLNESVLKKHDKDLKKISDPLNQDLENLQIELAIEKDGKIDYDDKGNYQFSKIDLPKINSKIREVNDKLSEETDKFLKDQVECRVFLDPIVLPADIRTSLEMALNNFVFTNISEFEEEIEEVKTKTNLNP